MWDFDRIETPENVELERRLAGIGTRFLAGLIDTLWLLLIFLALLLIGGLALSLDFDMSDPLANSASMWALAIFILIFFVVFWGYFVFFELMSNGQTPGKKTMKIRVVRLEGGPITFTDVAIRSLLRVVDSLPFFYALGGVVMFLSKRMQRLGDMAAGTVVVNEAVPDYRAIPKPGNKGTVLTPAQAAPSETADKTGLTDEEYRALQNYWSRRHELTPDARRRILPRLLEPILARSGLEIKTREPIVLEQWLGQLLAGQISLRPEPPSPPPEPLPLEPAPDALRTSEPDEPPPPASPPDTTRWS